MKGLALINANSLHIPLADQSVHMVATSPPYFGLRDYGVLNQLGLEPLHDCLAWAKSEEPCGRCFVCNLRLVARELWRVLRDDGTLWLNLGDSYGRGKRVDNVNDSKRGASANTGHVSLTAAKAYGQGTRAHLTEKSLIGVPWRVALALQADGWTLRSDVIWSKPNPMPESVTDRPTKAHEYVFLFSKRPKYFYDHEAVKEEAMATTLGPGSSFKRNGSKRVNCGPNSNMGTHRPDREDVRYNGNSRNRRSVWEVPPTPYPGSHFATWPPDLVEPMIKASTSEAGACSACGRQWARVVVKGEAEPIYRNPNPVNEYAAASGHSNGLRATTLHKTRPVIESVFEPACTCGCSPVPAVVLDPFAGSGTTLMVARRLGRAGVGLDLSYAYLSEQARPRLLESALPLLDF